MLELWWSEDAWLFASPTVLVIALLVMVFSDGLRVPAAVLLGIALAYFMGLLQRLVLASRQSLHEQTVRLTDDALETASSVGQASYRWSAVRTVTVTRRFVFLALGERRFTFPRAAFSEDAVAFAVEAARGAGARVHAR